MSELPTVQPDEWTHKVVAKKVNGRWDVKLFTKEGSTILQISELSRLAKAIRVAWNTLFQDYRRTATLETQRRYEIEEQKRLKAETKSAASGNNTKGTVTSA